MFNKKLKTQVSLLARRVQELEIAQTSLTALLHATLNANVRRLHDIKDRVSEDLEEFSRLNAEVNLGVWSDTEDGRVCLIGGVSDGHCDDYRGDGGECDYYIKGSCIKIGPHWERK